MRLFLAILMSLYLQQVQPMCYEAEYISFNYHSERYASAKYILVGRVLHTMQNRSHQAVRLKVTCIYRAPHEIKNSLLEEEIRFTMPYRRPCRPPLQTDTSYIFFFDDVFIVKKNRRRKKKKNSATDFTRMSRHRRKYVSLAQPIPVDEMDIYAMESLAQRVRTENPIGHCYNIWSKWSRCSEDCGMGTMERTYPRLNKTSLSQRAVCQHASCNSHSHDKDLVQFQPMSIGSCTSLELLRVTHCTEACPNPNHIRTAITWEMSLPIMLCNDIENEGSESVEYHNVAIPSLCGCVDPTSPEYISRPFSIIESKSEPSNSWRRRHLQAANLGEFREVV